MVAQFFSKRLLWKINLKKILLTLPENYQISTRKLPETTSYQNSTRILPEFYQNTTRILPATRILPVKQQGNSL